MDSTPASPRRFFLRWSCVILSLTDSICAISSALLMPRENCGEKSYCENTYIFKLQLPIDTLSLAVLLKSEEHLVKEPKLKVNVPRVEEPDYFLISYRRFFINFIHFCTIRVTMKNYSICTRLDPPFLDFCSVVHEENISIIWVI